jgi:hypothetical protein
MPFITFDSIFENPWTAIEFDVPPDASRLLLREALREAEFCYGIASRDLLEALNTERKPGHVIPMVELHDRHTKAAVRLKLLPMIYAERFGKSIYEDTED